MPVVRFAVAWSAFFLSCALTISGSSKFLARRQFTATLQQLEFVPKPFVPILSVLIPSLELSVSAWIVIGDIRSGALIIAVILILFSIVTAYVIRSGRLSIECYCFGPFTRSTFGPSLILRNIGLTLVAVFVFAYSSIFRETTNNIYNNYNILPVLFPVISVFPIYALAKFFLTNQDFFQYPSSFSAGSNQDKPSNHLKSERNYHRRRV